MRNAKRGERFRRMAHRRPIGLAPHNNGDGGNGLAHGVLPHAALKKAAYSPYAVKARAALQLAPEHGSGDNIRGQKILDLLDSIFQDQFTALKTANLELIRLSN